MWIGYQIIVGFAAGWAFQIALSNGQIHAAPEDMSQVTAIINLCVSIGGAFFVSAAQSAFNNQLINELVKNLVDKDPREALAIGATEIRHVFTTTGHTYRRFTCIRSG